MKIYLTIIFLFLAFDTSILLAQQVAAPIGIANQQKESGRPQPIASLPNDRLPEPIPSLKKEETALPANFNNGKSVEPVPHPIIGIPKEEIKAKSGTN